jgi:hypothetical protein
MERRLDKTQARACRKDGKLSREKNGGITLPFDLGKAYKDEEPFVGKFREKIAVP